MCSFLEQVGGCKQAYSQIDVYTLLWKKTVSQPIRLSVFSPCQPVMKQHAAPVRGICAHQPLGAHLDPLVFPSFALRGRIKCTPLASFHHLCLFQLSVLVEKFRLPFFLVPHISSSSSSSAQSCFCMLTRPHSQYDLCSADTRQCMILRSQSRVVVHLPPPLPSPPPVSPSLSAFFSSRPSSRVLPQNTDAFVISLSDTRSDWRWPWPLWGS